MFQRILLTIAILISVISCSNPVMGPEDNQGDDPIDVIGNPLDSLDDSLPELQIADFYVAGVVTDNSGKPVVGAVARLMKSGLSAITDADGAYKITGTSGLAKRTSSGELNDTLVIKVGNSNPGDSSEVVKTAVTSGVIMDLPPTYIVQREIRGYLEDEDLVLISKIEAYVYDKSAPDQVKEINLWHDVVNDAFSSFAYFSSETNKEYTLYVKVYDNNGKFIGQSPDYDFTDNTGNIIFKNPFKVINAKPTIKITVPGNAITNTKVKVAITAIDSFGGQITKCEVAVGDQNYEDISSYKLAKRMSSDGMTNEIEIVPDTSSMIYVKATDDENNVTIDSNFIEVHEPKISYNLYITGGKGDTPTVGDSINTGITSAAIGDSIFIGMKNFSCNGSLEITKVEIGSSLSKLITVNGTDLENAYIKLVVDTTGDNYIANKYGCETEIYCQVTMDNGSTHLESTMVKMKL